MRDWTRRRFLWTAVAGAAVARADARALAAPAAARRAPLSARARAALLAAMDAIVPEGDGMPSASAAGAGRYLETLASRDADVRRQLSRAIAALEREAGGRGFSALAPERRVEALRGLETKQPASFAALRDLVYEGYYTSPDVWKRLGFEFYGPDRPGPGLAPFDAAVVSKVKERAPSWQKVPS